MSEMKELWYMNKPMKWMPVNWDHTPLENEQLAYVDLQPGDGTRYELLVMRATQYPLARAFNLTGDEARDALFVTRLVGGDIMGGTLFGWMNTDSIWQISGENEWTVTLLEWWLDELLRRLNGN